MPEHTSETIREHIIAALHDLLGDKDVGSIDDDTNPIGQLGLRSPDGVDFACELSVRLGFEIPDKLNPLVDDERQRARTVREMVLVVSEIVGVQPETSYGQR
jgi:acyl carrier protein